MHSLPDQAPFVTVTEQKRQPGPPLPRLHQHRQSEGAPGGSAQRGPIEVVSQIFDRKPFDPRPSASRGPSGYYPPALPSDNAVPWLLRLPEGMSGLGFDALEPLNSVLGRSTKTAVKRVLDHHKGRTMNETETQAVRHVQALLNEAKKARESGNTEAAAFLEAQAREILARLSAAQEPAHKG